jgi:hypothetical protein
MIAKTRFFNLGGVRVRNVQTSHNTYSMMLADAMSSEWQWW